MAGMGNRRREEESKINPDALSIDESDTDSPQHSFDLPETVKYQGNNEKERMNPDEKIANMATASLKKWGRLFISWKEICVS